VKAITWQRHILWFYYRSVCRDLSNSSYIWTKFWISSEPNYWQFL